MHKGQVIGNYVLLDELDKGGMGEVWTAKQSDAKQSELIEWTVVIKGLKQDADPSERTWIQKEIRNLAVCRHPHIVPFIGPLVDGRDLYLVMQYIPGPNLKKRLKQEPPLSNDAKVSILTDLLTALVYLHEEAQIIHRDVKPANILLDAGERAYLADFGIAKFHQPDLTQTMGLHRGSPAYSARELYDGMATYASDVWSFGAVALEVFTGRIPDQGIPESRFAGPLTDEIRACLSEYRPSSKELLKAFQRVRHLGFDAASEQEQQLSDAPTMPLTAKQTSDSSLVQQPRLDAVAPEPEPEPEPLDQVDDLGKPIEPFPRAVKQSSFAPSGPHAAEAITSTSSEQGFDWTTASALGISAIGAVLLLLVALYGFARGAIPVPNWLSPVIAGPTDSETESSVGPTAASLPTASASTTSSREVGSIDVDSALYDPAVYQQNAGLQIGPNQYAIGPDDSPMIVLKWSVTMADGSPATATDDCRIAVSLTGTFVSSPIEYPKCQQDYTGGPSDGAPMFLLNTPGMYTFHLEDEVSGVQNELVVRVEG